MILKEFAQTQASQPNYSLSANATHFDRMAVLSHRTFIEISSTVHENFAGRKVIACMIMKKNDSDQDGIVVAMGTGNRCITGQRLSMEGKVVNDSHAEIVCRRAFIAFLYTELEKYADQQQSIFERNASSKPITEQLLPGKPPGGGQSSTSKLKLKNGITFHLYISTAPCGDGAIFTPRDTKGESGVDLQFPKEHCPMFTSKVNGVTRSKIENGEGTIPIEKGEAEQTFDGILRGQRLRTMSCSDKICRWNVVGMQGALLSHIIEPVYLKSLTLGYLYDHGHLSRAICCRLLKNSDSANVTVSSCNTTSGEQKQRFCDNLPSGFRLNHPWIGRVTQYEASRETEKTNNVSMNWTLHETNAEVTDGRTGAQMSRTSGIPTPSRLCKFEMLKRFKCIMGSLQGVSHLSLMDADGEKTYRELKDEAVDFQRAKKCFVDALRDLKYGPWVRKPREQDMFS